MLFKTLCYYILTVEKENPPRNLTPVGSTLSDKS